MSDETRRKGDRHVSDEAKRYYTQADIARMLNLSIAMVSKMSVDGEMPGRIQFGGSVRHERAAIERWLAEKGRDAAGMKATEEPND